jgi:hypothetical protein
MSLAWGNYSNGAIPTSVLVPVGPDAGGIEGDYLEATTYNAWVRWRNAVHADTGVWLKLDHSDTIPPGFRPLTGQQAAYDRYRKYGAPIASVPGQSNHGWARALDCTGFENRPDVWASMNAHAAACGLSNATGKASGERWHWECLSPAMTAASAGVIHLVPAASIPVPSEEEIMLIARRGLTGEIGIFGGGFAAPNGSGKGRHIFATEAEYNGFRAVCDMNRRAGVDKAPALPAFRDIEDNFTVDENGWRVVCGAFGV